MVRPDAVTAPEPEPRAAPEPEPRAAPEPEPRAAPEPEPGTRSHGSRARCAACGAPLEADQEWCVECGAARTVLHRPPDWRAPAAVVAVVVGVVVIAALIALVSLSIQAGR